MAQSPDEKTYVEIPFIEQLKGMGWDHVEGDIDVPYLTERESFRDVLLTGRLRKAIKEINLDDGGEPWLDDDRVNEVVSRLERITAPKLLEANKEAFDLIVQGIEVAGDPDKHDGREKNVAVIDFDHPERNDFIAINQFRVDVPGGKTFIGPDIVLFVNGIPLVVVECKSPKISHPMEEGINQLLRYSNQRQEVEEDEGCERLFYYNQFLVSTFRQEARAATVGAGYEHYMEWKDTSPVPMSEVAKYLGKENLNSQEILVAGMLRKEHLLDIIRNYILFDQVEGRQMKLMCRYQQFRAVHKAIHRIRTGKTKREHGDADQRGGIIWHTQGSGKSLTMVFLVRKMRNLPDLKKFKVVMITDRINLEGQLKGTAALTGETVCRADTKNDLARLMQEDTSNIVFSMVQKYQDQEPAIGDYEVPEYPMRKAAAPSGKKKTGYKLPAKPIIFPVWNLSPEILVLVDEAHRSHTSMLHANIMRALPNCAMIGFTGTPIIVAGRARRTHEIFGDYIDQYTIEQSQKDGSTVKILYEGRKAEAKVEGGRTLDQFFDDMFRSRTEEEREAIRRRYGTVVNILEAKDLIAAKAEDMLLHYAANILPNGFKAQVVAVSRQAAIRYYEAFGKARSKLLRRFELLDPNLFDLPEDEQENLDEETRFLIIAAKNRDILKKLEFAAIISGDHNDLPSYKEHTDKARHEILVGKDGRFKQPLSQDKLAIIIVKSMLLVGFDAPVEQVMYLDRFMQGHELLQAIARVNRRYTGKTRGLVVDYFGVGDRLTEALAIYSQEDIKGALINIKDELPKLDDRHRRVLALFSSKGIDDILDIDACVDALRDIALRAEFIIRFAKFAESMDIILPRPEALPYIYGMKVLGFINKTAANRYRDSQLNIAGVGNKVKQLIDEHIVAQGVDPKVPPISILDRNFEKEVGAIKSKKTQALEMEHAVRFHIEKHHNEDPAFYKKLSERLKDILDAFHDNWEGLAEVLEKFIRGTKRGREEDQTGLDPKTQAPFLGILIDEYGKKPSEREMKDFCDAVVDMVDHIRQEIAVVDFWRSRHMRDLLRTWIIIEIDDRNLIPFDKQERLADRFLELAKALHLRLIRS
ncbi:MAG: restriction endonuclease subunit R [Deltaproteobacteria bacterium]|nr:MAG: restriction endonuclease subunit R [Deltaproteobacteria bacterium]